MINQYDKYFLNNFIEAHFLPERIVHFLKLFSENQRGGGMGWSDISYFRGDEDYIPGYVTICFNEPMSNDYDGNVTIHIANEIFFKEVVSKIIYNIEYVIDNMQEIIKYLNIIGFDLGLSTDDVNEYLVPLDKYI